MVREQWRIYRHALWELRLHEPGRGALYALAGAAGMAAVTAVPPAVVAIGVFAAHGEAAQLAVGLASLLTVPLVGAGWKRRMWARPIDSRLRAWQEWDPSVQVSVNVAEADTWAVSVTLMRVGFVVIWNRTRGDVGAMPLNQTIGVARSRMLPPTDYDAQQALVIGVLEEAGIAGNVGGVAVPVR